MTDTEFAEAISTDYKIPLQDVVSCVTEIRNIVDDNLSKIREGFEFEKKFRKLIAPDTEIWGLTILTDKGKILIEADNYMFDTFRNPIERAIKKFKWREKEWQYRVNNWALSFPFGKVTIWAKSLNLGPFQQRVIIGMFDCHFALSARNKIKTPEQWGKHPTKHLSYKHYLADHIRRKLNKWRQ